MNPERRALMEALGNQLVAQINEFGKKHGWREDCDSYVLLGAVCSLLGRAASRFSLPLEELLTLVSISYETYLNEPNDHTLQ